MQLIPVKALVHLRVQDKITSIPVLVSEQAPVNLLGQDALCSLGTQMTDRIHIDKMVSTQVDVV